MQRRIVATAVMLCIAAKAQAQLVIAFDDSTAGVTTCYAWDFNNTGAGWQPLFSDLDVWALAADNVNNKLYVGSGSTLYSWDYANLGSNTPPTAVANFTFNGSGVNFVGLAYNPTNGKLYGTRNIAVEAIYEIDPATAIATQLFTYTSSEYALDGLDYNPADGMLYAADDTTTGGSGLFRIDIATQSITFVAPYPTFVGASGDVDGLAIGDLDGNVRAYFVIDNPGEIGIYNLTTGLEETPLTNPWTTSEIFSGGAWASTLFVPPVGADVRITKTDNPDPVVPPGGNITYTITVRNAGPEPATGVMASDTLPAEVNFISVTPPGVFESGVVTANIGDMAAGTEVTFDITVQTTGAGTVSNTATVTSTSSDPNPGNDSATATTIVRDPEADLAVAISAPADCSVPVGGNLGYTITVTNTAGETANNTVLTVTLPGNANFIGSNPPGTLMGGILTIDLGAIGSGSNAVVTVDLQATESGTVTLGASADADENDPDPSDNAASADTLVQPAPPATANAAGIFSTIASSPTSDVPGLPGAKFSSTSGFDRPFRSLGGRWIFFADTDLATTMDTVVVAVDGSTAGVVAQEGVTVLPEGDLVGTIDTVLGINDAGQFVFSTNTDGATAADEVVVKWDGTQFITVAREGNPIDPIPGAVYGTTSGSTTIRNDGTVSFYTTFGTDSALLRGDGAVVVAQEGVTVPEGQSGGDAFAWDEFDSGTTDGQGFFMSADGAHYIAKGDTLDTVTTNDEVVVLDNAVVIQEDEILPGSGFTIGTDQSTPVNQAIMEPDGTWFAYGDNNDDIDWAVRNGDVIAVTDTEIFPGAGELWDDAPYSQTFFYAFGNNVGDYIVGGTTNAGDLINAVLVLNGAEVVARENDPVDLNDDGVFDDGVYIATFRDDFAYLTDDGQLVFVARLRDQAEALCGDGDNDIGQALIRVQLDLGVEQCAQEGCDRPNVDTDFNGDCIVDLTDLATLLSNFGTGSGALHEHGDTDADGDIDLTDLAGVLSRFGANCN